MGPRRRLLLTLALVLAALVCIDCLNLTQSPAWSDITQAPHLAAVRRATDTDAHRLVKQADRDPVGVVVPTPIAVCLACLLWGLAGSSPYMLSARPRFRRRLRAPPAPPVQLHSTPIEPEERSCPLTTGTPGRSRRRTHPTTTSMGRTWRSSPGRATRRCVGGSRPLAPLACC